MNKIKSKFLLIAVMVSSSLYTFAQSIHVYDGSYNGRKLYKIAFPIGGMGAGMFCLDGAGAISHFSVRNSPDVFNEPPIFAAIGVKGHPEQARVLEGPVPDWKKFGGPRTGDGAPGTTWGLARFRSASFLARFPFAHIEVKDQAIPLKVSISGWSPFIPTDADDSCLPVGALGYTFTNTSGRAQDYVFSYNAASFFGDVVEKTKNGFILTDTGSKAHPEEKGNVAFFCNQPNTTANPAWFRGGFYDAQTMAWKAVREASAISGEPIDHSPGASLYVPFKLSPGQSKTIRLMICWYVPNTHLRMGWFGDAKTPEDFSVPDRSNDQPSSYYMPWYASKFKSINEVMDFWKRNYDDLMAKTKLFTDAFYKSTLPPEVMEAVSANLSILKSTTILRQYDGRFWGWEGSHDEVGSCPGSCTHVYNYAQSLCHLFPAMERSMRETEFGEDQSTTGNQSFRAEIPIRPAGHEFYPAADGQLGGIIKVYRDWHISGDSAWIKKLYPKVKLSLDFCIQTWDPKHNGTIAEPHHNTYDIEFWGAEPLCTGFYAGALEAFIQLSRELHETDGIVYYEGLLAKAKAAMNNTLYNGSYFEQKVQWKGLEAGDPVEAAKHSFAGALSPEATVLLNKEGPRYQYGKGVLSDGMLGAWLCQVSGLPVPFDEQKLKSHLNAVYAYNFRADLSQYSNPQRPTYALGNEGGLLLCSWPKGGEPSLPFVYSNEVWTGIEYEVASHLIMEGKVKEGLNIVRTTRKRYDGTVRNPFDEYECGHWYARAMSSYALLQALTGIRYDAVTQTLYVNSKVGSFTSFLSTDTGFGNVSYQDGKVSLKVVYGNIPVKHIAVSKT
jgi:uncharacterized protein (DUF608 family)